MGMFNHACQSRSTTSNCALSNEAIITIGQAPPDLRAFTAKKQEIHEQGLVSVVRQIYEDRDAAMLWFSRSLNSSRKNGWNVVYDGLPLEG